MVHMEDPCGTPSILGLHLSRKNYFGRLGFSDGSEVHTSNRGVEGILGIGSSWGSFQ